MNEAARRKLEELMDEGQVLVSERHRSPARGARAASRRVEGRVEGRAEAKAQAVLTVYGSRGP